MQQNVIATNFNFRTKFKKLLNEENHSAIMSAFEKFCMLDSSSAREVLWRMTFSTETAYAELEKLGLSSKIVPMENIKAFRNEFRSEYKKMYSDFLDEDIHIECQEAYNTLAAHTDLIVARVVYLHCWQALYYSKANMFKNEIERTLFLLKDDKENYFFGGLRSLNFNMEEANFLMPFHIDIYNLLVTVNEIFDKENITETKTESSETQQQVVEENEEFVESFEDYEEFKPITPEEVLMHKEVFYSFVYKNDFNILMVLGHLGFDLNEVMAKKEKIKNFLCAIKNLEEK